MFSIPVSVDLLSSIWTYQESFFEIGKPELSTKKTSVFSMNNKEFLN